MVKTAVIGVGRWGQHFARLFSQHPEFELVALVDRNQQQAAAIHAKLQLSPSVTLYADLDEALRQFPHLEAVMIATPATSHRDLIQTALSKGLHVLAEKPLTLDVDDCAALTYLAAQNEVQLFVDHTYLFHPAVGQGLDVLPQLGTLRYGYATRTHLGPVRTDVNALWDLAIHDIAIFNHWLGQLPIAVRAWGQAWLQSALDRQDVVWATLHYPNGFTANCHWCWDNPDKQRRLGVVGDRGTLLFDEINREHPLQILWGESRPNDMGYYLPHHQTIQFVEFPNQEPLKIVCDRFLESLQTGRVSNEATGETATALVIILQALTRSLQTGETVQLENPPILPNLRDQVHVG